jgi:hypothetical protein
MANIFFKQGKMDVADSLYRQVSFQVYEVSRYLTNEMSLYIRLKFEEFKYFYTKIIIIINKNNY